MKTITCQEPLKFEFTEKERPKPTKGEVLVKIRRIGICGTDLHAFQGHQAFFEYPRVLGHELSGEVAEFGPETKKDKLSTGDNVLIVPYLHCGECVACRRGHTNCCANMQVIGVHQDGGMCEYLAVPETHVLKVDNLDLNAMALVECLAIGAHAVRRADIQNGDNTLVIGAGPIGLAAMQFAKAAGANVIALDLNQGRLDFCASDIGVSASVNPTKEDAIEKIKSLTNGEFCTSVIDATGHAGSMMGAVEYCSHSANLVYVGLSKDKISYDHPNIHKRELTIMCSRNATLEDFQHVADCLNDGRAKSTCMITHTCSFEEMIENFPSWTKAETGVIKAMVELND
jgi:2-desacetyl-2-hydroxyethyl bacteriochlorophyllide A dehydrogenase